MPYKDYERQKENTRKNYRKNVQARLEYSRKYRKSNPDVRWKSSLRKYNLTPDDYILLMLKQGCLCAICNKPESSDGSGDKKGRLLSVDHCHETGKVRGLLCSRCNSAIGLMDECEERLGSAIQYIKHHRRHRPATT